MARKKITDLQLKQELGVKYPEYEDELGGLKENLIFANRLLAASIPLKLSFTENQLQDRFLHQADENKVTIIR